MKILMDGKSYVMKGILMDKGSKKPVRIKGKPVQAECTFIPQEGMRHDHACLFFRCGRASQERISLSLSAST